MTKSGQAYVPTTTEITHLFKVIQGHRHPEKNTAIMQLSFKLGLRVHEIACLKLKDVCKLSPVTKTASRNLVLHDAMTLPAAHTTGENNQTRSKSTYKRTSVTFKISDFNKIIKEVVKRAKAGEEINPATYYPIIRQQKGKTRDLPILDSSLRTALLNYLRIRLKKSPTAKPSDPLFITQKGGPYSPNTLQEHMALMLRNWAGIEKASSHSGRRTLITNIIQKQKKSIEVAQKVAGHKHLSSTCIYDESPEDEAIEDSLKRI